MKRGKRGPWSDEPEGGALQMETRPDLSRLHLNGWEHIHESPDVWVIRVRRWPQRWMWRAYRGVTVISGSAKTPGEAIRLASHREGWL